MDRSGFVCNWGNSVGDEDIEYNGKDSVSQFSFNYNLLVRLFCSSNSESLVRKPVSFVIMQRRGFNTGESLMDRVTWRDHLGARKRLECDNNPNDLDDVRP